MIIKYKNLLSTININDKLASLSKNLNRLQKDVDRLLKNSEDYKTMSKKYTIQIVGYGSEIVQSKYSDEEINKIIRPPRPFEV